MTAALSDKDLRELVDRLLFEQGRLDPLEFLLAADLLAYEDYESWRLGRHEDLQAALRLGVAETVECLTRAGAYARRQKLEATGLEYRAWGGGERILSFGPEASLKRVCTQGWVPAADRRQLDLFQDSGELLLEDAIRLALAERRGDAAREQVAQLMRANPRHPRLGGFLRLIQCIDAGDGQVDGNARERSAELEAIDPVARDLLGHRARDVLAVLWSDLAQQLAGEPFDPTRPQRHASHAWARAGRWDAVRDSVERLADWRERPALVRLHAESAWHRRDPVTARRDWIWLCWEHPLYAERAFVSTDFPDPWLASLWRAFGDLDPPLETEDFPAWLLLHDPTESAQVPADDAPSGERGDAYRLLRRLVGGEDDIRLRRQLDELDPRLLRLFLSRGRNARQ
ncbi:hypothetical protein [Thiocystis violacea]|uniref:hypothetical protein n=1 Tax=Thiocystis violacea TaxID=13725 RepID=UPI0019050F86|nr:hypothetical protein [Thiocystis violacea]MBK1716162.1 hypothetical protein [Thiocystis violacea]